MSATKLKARLAKFNAREVEVKARDEEWARFLSTCSPKVRAVAVTNPLHDLAKAADWLGFEFSGLKEDDGREWNLATIVFFRPVGHRRIGVLVSVSRETLLRDPKRLEQVVIKDLNDDAWETVGTEIDRLGRRVAAFEKAAKRRRKIARKRAV